MVDDGKVAYKTCCAAVKGIEAVIGIEAVKGIEALLLRTRRGMVEGHNASQRGKTDHAHYHAANGLQTQKGDEGGQTQSRPPIN
jgi:hypothetical protein